MMISYIFFLYLLNNSKIYYDGSEVDEFFFNLAQKKLGFASFDCKFYVAMCVGGYEGLKVVSVFFLKKIVNSFFHAEHYWTRVN